MAHSLAAKLALASLCTGIAAGNFVPFANVEELKPRRIDEFCGSETFPGKDGKGQLRRCEHHFHKQLEDGGDVELGWKMNVDPDSILSLDTEAEHGVLLTRCRNSELELELPESHARHAVAGKLIVASRFIHKCDHLSDRHLYHRVTEVLSQQWKGAVRSGSSGSRVSHVRLATEELTSLAHAIPSLSFYFSWMPVEAREGVPFPEMRTDYGLNRPFLDKKRKLLSFPSFPSGLKQLSGVAEDAGGFKSGGESTGNFDTQNGILNLMPKQLSNFGWNWNFFMNTTQEPNFEMDIPGAKGILKVRKPYIKVHSGIYLNFSSEFGGLTLPPKVHWTWGLRGQGQVQARMLASMNTTSDTGTDPFMAFKLPVLQELENPVWFEKIDFATGTLPLSMEPGFQFTAQMYHQGNFKGAVGLGGRTQGEINPSLTYDSIKGFDAKFEGNLTDTDLWPPLWMIFTKKFEMGLMLKPSLLMRGDFAGLERATMAIETRPYMNLTITREGQSPTTTDELKTLTVYPMRVMGISTVDFNMQYKVKISANGLDVETSPQINWGQVEYRDHITNFACGQLPQKTLMNPALSKIMVTLIQVDNSSPQPVLTTLGVGQATCGSLLNGECSPSPANVVILSSSGETMATVQLSIIWETDPEPWFASKIRGLGFSFPQVILRQDTLTSAFPNANSLTPGSAASSISMHLIHGGQTYIIGLVGTIGDQQSALAGDSTIQFGPGFTDSWAPCQLNTQDCQSPRIELYAGSTQIGVANLPAIEFSSQTAMQGTGSSGFMSSSSSAGEMNVPSTIALTAPGETSTTVAVITMNANVVMTLESSMFLSPRSQIQVPLSSSLNLSWTISDVVRTQTYSFTLQAYSLVSVSATNMQTYVNYRQVNGMVLMPVSGGKQTFSSKCTSMSSTGLPASEAPCNFATTTSFKGSGYSNGDMIVVLVEWSVGGTNNQLFSPPILLGGSSGGLGRRLLSPPLGPVAQPRRLWSQEAWNARISQHNTSCTKRDLKFNLGMGMLMRGKVDSISVPAGFPMIGGLDEQPALTTGFRKIAAIKPGEDAQQLLGGPDGILCQAGLCEGALPGCSQGGPKKMNFPKLVFDFNRPLHFGNRSGRFNGVMKQALAYAFSTLPEMVDVVIQQMNHSGSPFGPPKPATTTLAPTNWWSDTQSPAPAPSVQWPTQPVASAPVPAAAAPQEDDSLTDAFNKWWSGAGSRRLTAAEKPVAIAGVVELLPEKLQSHQARLEFKHGVPFIIDRPLVEMMLQHGYFMGLDDVEDDATKTHGPLQITGFYVDSGALYSSSSDWHGARTNVVSNTTTAFAMFFAVVGAVSLAALAVLKRSSGSRSKAPQSGYLGELSDGNQGLE